MRAIVVRQGGRAARDDERAGAPRSFGRLLKFFREREGFTRGELGDKLGYSADTVASFEQGRRVAQPQFIDAAEAVLNADGVLATLKPDQAVARYPAHFQDMARIEAGAVSRFSYDSQVVSGLLQTEEYAHALLSAHFPPLDEVTITERVEARLERQTLITQDKPLVTVFVIEEAALQRQVGGVEVHRAQLRRLRETAALRHVALQVLPTSRAAHSGLNGPMVLLETAEREHLVYLECQDVGTMITDRAQVSEFWLRYGMLRSQALNTEESARLIDRMVEEL